MHLIKSQLSVQYSRGNNEYTNWRTAPKITLLLELYIIFTEADRQRERERGGDMEHDLCSGLLLVHCVNSSLASTVKLSNPH